MHFFVDRQKPHSGFAKHSPQPEVISGHGLKEVALVAFFVSLPSISFSNCNSLSIRDELVVFFFVLLCLIGGGRGSISTPVSSSMPVMPVPPVLLQLSQSLLLFKNKASCAAFEQLGVFLQPLLSSRGDSISLRGTSPGDTVNPSLN